MSIRKTQLRLKDLIRVQRFLTDIGYNIDNMTINEAIAKLTEQVMYGVTILSTPEPTTLIDIDRLIERMKEKKKKK